MFVSFCLTLFFRVGPRERGRVVLEVGVDGSKDREAIVAMIMIVNAIEVLVGGPLVTLQWWSGSFTDTERGPPVVTIDDWIEGNG